MTALGVRAERADASVLGAVAIGLLLAIAPVMAIAHRSSPLLLALCAVAALAAWTYGRGLEALRLDLADAASGPLAWAIAAFLVWAGVAILWSFAPGRSAGAWVEFAGTVAAALVVVRFVPHAADRRMALLLAASLILASALILADLSSGLVARRWFGMRSNSFVLNRPALTLLVLLPAAIVLLVRHRLAWLAALTALAVAAAILRSDSGAARLGLVILVLCAGLALLHRRAASALVLAGLLGALAIAPVSGELAERVLPPGLYRVLAGAHARDRVDIWRSYGAALRLNPIAGAGFGASARLDEAPWTAGLDPDMRTLLAVGHPHSAPLQIWVELGAIGAALAAAIAVLVVDAVTRLRRLEAAAAIGLLASGLAVSLVGQGAWQGWWPAAIGASMAWLGASHEVTGSSPAERGTDGG